MSTALHIAILGAGNVGGALGRLWLEKGHKISFGLPDPEKTRRSIPPGAEVTTNRQAAAGAHVVVLTVPWPAAQEAVETAGELDNKILIDCTNPLAPDMQTLVVGTTRSAAETVAGWAPKARVVKAFNTIGAPNYGNAQFGAERADGFYCGDDLAAKDVVRGLIEEIGLEPVDVGPLRNARCLEPLALLWIDLAIHQRQGTDHAFKLLRR
ncbi:MAG: NADPH-dependent F420 reductase [Acidobacteriaceae bacterium]|nr:NADPH-dependent F420 reductase [Acidobacteriaceae bacterium]